MSEAAIEAKIHRLAFLTVKHPTVLRYAQELKKWKAILAAKRQRPSLENQFRKAMNQVFASVTNL